MCWGGTRALSLAGDCCTDSLKGATLGSSELALELAEAGGWGGEVPKD